MKITRRQLKHIIESYQGLVGGPETEGDEKEIFVFDTPDQNPLAAGTTGTDIPGLTDASKQKIGVNVKVSPEKQKAAIARSAPKKRFAQKADRIFGEKTFPGSNVYLIPVAGSEKELTGLAFDYKPQATGRDFYFTKTTAKNPESAKYYSDPKPKKLSDIEMNIFQNRRLDFETSRHLVFDLSAEGINILSNLGVLVSEIEKIDLENDIVFVPSLTGVSKNFAGLPRMILHSLFDPQGEHPNPNSLIDDIIRPLQDKIRKHASSLGLVPALDAGINSEDKNVSQMAITFSKIGTTAAFREAKIFTLNDIISEFLVQEITNSSPPAGATYLWSKRMERHKLEIFPKGQRGVTFNNFYFGFLPDGTKQIENRFLSGTELPSNHKDFEPNTPNSKAFFLELREDIKEAAAQIREKLKGKIVLVNTV